MILEPFRKLFMLHLLKGVWIYAFLAILPSQISPMFSTKYKDHYFSSKLINKQMKRQWYDIYSKYGFTASQLNNTYLWACAASLSFKVYTIGLPNGFPTGGNNIDCCENIEDSESCGLSSFLDGWLFLVEKP